MQHGPVAAGWLLVALCLAIGLYCLTRLPGSRGHRRWTAGTESVMGLAMAAMAVPGAMGPAWTAPAFAVLFGCLALAALTGALRGVPHGRHHALEAAAMVYLCLAMAGAARADGGRMAAMHAAPPAGVPVLTGALLLYFAAHVLRSGAALLPASAGAEGGAPAAARTPDLSGPCRLCLAAGTFAMLLTL